MSQYHSQIISIQINLSFNQIFQRTINNYQNTDITGSQFADMNKNIKVMWMIVDNSIKQQQIYLQKTKCFPYNSIEIIERFFDTSHNIEFNIRAYLYQEIVSANWIEPSQSDCLVLSFIGKDAQTLNNILNNEQFIYKLNNLIEKFQKPDVPNYVMMTTQSLFDTQSWMNTLLKRADNFIQNFLILLSMAEQIVRTNTIYQRWVTTNGADMISRNIQFEFNKTDFKIVLMFKQQIFKIKGRKGKIVRVEEIQNDGTIKFIKDYQTKQIWTKQKVLQMVDKKENKHFIDIPQFQGVTNDNGERQGVRYYQNQQTSSFVYVCKSDSFKQDFLLPGIAEGVIYNGTDIAEGVKYNCDSGENTYFGDLKIQEHTIIAHGSGILVDKNGISKKVQAVQDIFFVVSQNPIIIEAVYLGKRINPNFKIVVPLLQMMDKLSYPFNQFKYQINQSEFLQINPEELVADLLSKCDISAYTVISIGEMGNTNELLNLIQQKDDKFKNLFISFQKPIQEVKKRGGCRFQLFSRSSEHYMFRDLNLPINIELHEISSNSFEIKAFINYKIISGIIRDWRFDPDSILEQVEQPK